MGAWKFDRLIASRGALHQLNAAPAKGREAQCLLLPIEDSVTTDVHAHNFQLTRQREEEGGEIIFQDNISFSRTLDFFPPLFSICFP